MAIVTRTTNAGEIHRDIEIGTPNGGLVLAHVTETHRGKTTDTLYWLRRQSAAWGKAFTVEKGEDGTVYNVMLDSLRGDSCDCPHGCYRGHIKPCRHIELVHLAINEQKI
jgi:hypothetical protein